MIDTRNTGSNSEAGARLARRMNRNTMARLSEADPPGLGDRRCQLLGRVLIGASKSSPVSRSLPVS